MPKFLVTPRFNSKEIIRDTIEKDWKKFVKAMYKLGKRTKDYMKNYITINVHRPSGSTGNLAKSINLYRIATMDRLFIGVGSIAVLNKKAPYWYVVATGKKVGGAPFIPGGGKLVPGYFGDGDRPLSGKGTQRFTYAPYQGKFMMKPGVIRPIRYIQATWARAEIELSTLLATFK